MTFVVFTFFDHLVLKAPTPIIITGALQHTDSGTCIIGSSYFGT
jgi:hypothetical protein